MLTSLSGACALLTFAPAAHADFYLHHWENRREFDNTFRLALTGGYYASNTNYDSNGSAFIPNGLSQYGRIQGDALLTLGLSPRLTAYARGSWARIQLEHTTRGGITYGLTDQALGANFRAWKAAPGSGGAFESFDLQLQADIPAYNNATSDANLTAHLGDQTLDVTAGAFLTARIADRPGGKLLLVSGAGYTWRSNSYSAAIPWSVSLQYTPRLSRFIGSLSALGSWSLQNDPRANVAAFNSSTYSTSTGGSYMADAVNPSIAQVRGIVGYQSAEELRVLLSVTQPVMARLAPGGLYATITGELRLTGPGARGEASERETGRPANSEGTRDYNQANPNFIQYTLEGRVTRVSDRLSLIRINKGAGDGVESGQIFDVFAVKPDGGLGSPVARARVSSLKADEAALTVIEYYQEVWIEEGFVVKRALRQ